MSDPNDPLISPKARVMRLVRHSIESGDLAPGDPIPSEMHLAEYLGVTRATVRSAFDLLEVEGLVRVQGKGRVVAGVQQPAGAAAAPPPAVLIVNGHSGPQPSYHRSPAWSIHAQGTLETRLRAAGFTPKPLPWSAVHGEFARPPSEQPVGMVLLCDGGIDHELMRTIEHYGRAPAVVYAADRDEPLAQGMDTVAVDHGFGGAALVDWLVGQGRSHLHRVWFQVWNGATLPLWLARRDDGMRNAAERHGLVLHPTITVPWLDSPPASELFAHFWQLGVLALAGALAPVVLRGKPCDSLLMLHDAGALQAWSALAHLGGDHAGRLLVTGHDALWDEAPERPLQARAPSATIARDNIAVGNALADLILARLGGTAPPTRQTRVIIPRLVIPG